MPSVARRLVRDNGLVPIGRPESRTIPQAGQVGLDHPAYDVLEADGRRPAEVGADPGRVAGEGRARRPGGTGPGRRRRTPPSRRCRRSGTPRRRTPPPSGSRRWPPRSRAARRRGRRAPSRRRSPGAQPQSRTAAEVAEGEPRGGAGGDRGHAGGDLAGHELLGPARRLVVVEDQARPRAGRGGGRRRPSGGRRPSRRRTGSPGGPASPRPAATGRAGRRSPRWTPGRTAPAGPARSWSWRADSSSPTAARPLTRAVSSGWSHDCATELTAARL